MATFDGIGFDDLIADMLEESALVSKAADDVLAAGAAVTSDCWKAAIKSHDLIDTGDMLASVAAGPVQTDGNDVKYIYVSPQGKDHKGVRNAEKAFINHYGTSKIKATHFVDDAETEASEKAADAMQDVWNKQKGG